MGWIKPRQVRCPKCGYVQNTRKEPGDIIMCSKCSRHNVVGAGRGLPSDGRFKQNQRDPRPVECDKCGHTIRTRLPQGAVSHCAKCHNPVLAT